MESILAIPRGRAASYGYIARAAGLRGGARQVARVLHSMSEKHSLPWHRVIRSDGFIALDSCRGGDLQATLLRAEGVEVSEEGWVDLEKYGPGSA
jgi:methylated-DNA-protein-cysteine methyltransferase-like protein